MQEIKFTLIKHLGPSVFKAQIPNEIVKKLNTYIDDIAKNKTKSDKLDYGKKLVGDVTQEFFLEPELIKSSGWLEFLATCTKKWIELETSKSISKFNIISSWVVRQFENEYNPTHWHSGHIPGAGFLKVPNSSSALGLIASNFYDNPSEKLQLIGITGTNGKTTCATILYDLFRLLGYKTGLISTVNIRVLHKIYPSTHTTPDALSINKLLSQMVDEGCKFCFMEASSHAIHQNRISGLQFKGAVFTNITHDHLDYHKTFDDYILAKKALFDSLPSDST